VTKGGTSGPSTLVQAGSRKFAVEGVALGRVQVCGVVRPGLVGMRAMRLFPLLALFVLVLPSASMGGNHGVFTDPAGDNQGGSAGASDITSVEITSADDGAFTFKVSMSDPQGRLISGDQLNVAIDSDLNASNGYNGTGYDVYLQEFGSSSGPPRFQLCNYTDRLECKDYMGSEASDVATGSNSHVVTFNNTQGGWKVIRFYAYEVYTSPTTGSRYSDSTQLFTFDLNADPDHDGATGSEDNCPTIKGTSPRNRGCPNPLPLPHYTYFWADSSAPVVAFRQFRVTGAPPGTTVTVRHGGRAFHRRGSGEIRGLSGRPLHVGSTLTISFTSGKNFGRFLVLRVGGGSVTTVRDGCTQIGNAKPLSSCP
jgi:hypothetical protein